MSDGPHMTREQFTELVATLDESLKAYAKDIIPALVAQHVAQAISRVVDQSDNEVRKWVREIVETRLHVIIKLDGKDL